MEATQQKPKVLVVDDDRVVLLAVSEILSREGYVVQSFEEALEGLAVGRDEVSQGSLEVASLSNLPYTEAKRLAMRAFERRYLSSLLERHANNISSAARAAGVDRSNFRRLLKQYGVGGRSTTSGGQAPRERMTA